jgi:hypothetical protein
MIVVTKANGGYLAEATPPHALEEWRSGTPMAAKALVAELLAQGIH